MAKADLNPKAMNKSLKIALCLTGMCSLALSAMPAKAITFQFKNIETNKLSELSGAPFVKSFSLDVSNSGNGTVSFQIANAENYGAIGAVYFDDTYGLLSNFVLNVNNSGTVDFKYTGTKNLPQGNKIGFSTDFSAESNPGKANKYSVNREEVLGISINADFKAVITALHDEKLRVGIHVQQIGVNGDSDSFVSDGGNVAAPEPLGILGTGVAFGFGALFNKRRIDTDSKAASRK